MHTHHAGVQAAEAGSFFRRFPRWRELISINKRATGRWDYEYNQRHDWNSLLPDPSSSAQYAVGEAFNFTVVPCLTYDGIKGTYGVATGKKRSDRLGTPGDVTDGTVPACYAADYSTTDARFGITNVADRLLFGRWSDKYYPPADTLADYMAYWASADAPRGSIMGPASPLAALPRHALRIRFGTTVTSVQRAPTWEHYTEDAALAAARGVPRFRLVLANGDTLDCAYLIMAGGLQQLNRPDGINVDTMAANYWTHSNNLADYFNKSVLLLGRGNGAFEIAHNVLEVAERVIMLGRANKRVALSWETHYPVRSALRRRRHARRRSHTHAHATPDRAAGRRAHGARQAAGDVHAEEHGRAGRGAARAHCD